MTFTRLTGEDPFNLYRYQVPSGTTKTYVNQAAESQYLAAMRANDRARLQDLQLPSVVLKKSLLLLLNTLNKSVTSIKRKMQRGMYIAYNGGVPQEELDDLDVQEQEGEALDQQTREVANKVEQEGDPILHRISARCLPGLSTAMPCSPFKWAVLLTVHTLQAFYY